MSYGVTPQGFNRKSPQQILADLEARMVTQFGVGVIQSPQSTLGQLNRLMSDAIRELWEYYEHVYQSYDPDQAMGLRLDSLAKIRVIGRGANEEDPEFRNAITNLGRARIDIQDLVREVRDIVGVTYVQIFLNEGDIEDADTGLVPGSIAVAVIGGDDAEIATTVRRFVVPGITTAGNETVSTIVDGYCRSVRIIRPILIPVSLTIKVRIRNDRLGCPAPSFAAIEEFFVQAASSPSPTMFLNGDDVSLYRVRQLIESAYQTVEVVHVVGTRDEQILPFNETVRMGFFELAVFDIEDVTVELFE
jgi:hypothetical protein